MFCEKVEIVAGDTIPCIYNIIILYYIGYILIQSSP